MNDEKEETYPRRNDCHINIRTLKSTMLKEYNEIIHDDDDDDDKRLNVHSYSIIRELEQRAWDSPSMYTVRVFVQPSG